MKFLNANQRSYLLTLLLENRGDERPSGIASGAGGWQRRADILERAGLGVIDTYAEIDSEGKARERRWFSLNENGIAAARHILAHPTDTRARSITYGEMTPEQRAIVDARFAK